MISGPPRSVTAVSNNDVTTFAVDPLGRTTSVTRQGDGSTPSVTFEYRVTAGVLNYVRTNRLLSGTSYLSSWEYLDGLGRTLQVQEPDPTGAGGRRLTTTRYDGLGQVWGVSQPCGATGAPGSGLYDADGNRQLRTTGTTTTLYLDGMELAATGTTVTAKRYYGGLAMRTSGGVTVLLHNRQNSTSAAYDTTADTVAYQRYTPYGSRRGAVPLAATERRFLDKTEDATGLTAMGARYYDPTAGRFVSIDPLANLMQPQSLAGYSYSLGNPATFADPSGLTPIVAGFVSGLVVLLS